MSNSESKTGWTFVAFWVFVFGILALCCVSQYIEKEQEHKHRIEMKQLEQEAGK